MATELGFTGSAQAFVVTAGIWELRVDLVGGAGGRGGTAGTPGAGAEAIAVTPGEALRVTVGGWGGASGGGGGGRRNLARRAGGRLCGLRLGVRPRARSRAPRRASSPVPAPTPRRMLPRRGRSGGRWTSCSWSGQPSSTVWLPTDSRRTLAHAYRRTARAGRPSAAASPANTSRLRSLPRPVAGLPLDREALRGQAPRRIVVVQFQSHERKARERVRDPPRVAERPVDGEALLEEQARLRVVASGQRDPAERPGPDRDAADVPEPTRRAHALLEEALGLVELPPVREHNAGVAGGVRLGREIARSPRDLEPFLGELVRLGRRHLSPEPRSRGCRGSATTSRSSPTPAMDGQARLTEATHRLVVALHDRERRDPRLGPASAPLRAGAPGQQPLQALATLRRRILAAARSARAPRRSADRSPPPRSPSPRSARRECWRARRRAARASAAAAVRAARARPPLRARR